MSAPFRLANGATCRAWDDFLTVSAQSWSALREELTSGRLSAFLGSIGRSDLAPRGSGTPDERLDAWLAALPTSKPAEAALDVHPTVLRVRAVSGGGTVKRSIVVTNVGYRLLRSTVRVDAPGSGWVRLGPEFAGRPFVTTEQTEIPVEVMIPDTLTTPLSATVIIEGNGGTRRVEVRVEPPPKTEPIPEPSAGPAVEVAPWLLDRLAGLSPALRLAFAAAIAATLRAVLAVGDRLSGDVSLPVSSRPGLGGAAALFALFGALAAGVLAFRKGERGGLLPAAFAGGVGGVFLAAVVVAACRSLEPAAVTGGSALLAVAYWAALGGLVGAGSSLAVAYRRLKPAQREAVS
jgi:hypothetical protein